MADVAFGEDHVESSTSCHPSAAQPAAPRQRTPYSLRWHCWHWPALLPWRTRSRGVPRISAKLHNNLPAQRVRLIGREQDLRAAEDALLGSVGRLLTLT